MKDLAGGMDYLQSSERTGFAKGQPLGRGEFLYKCSDFSYLPLKSFSKWVLTNNIMYAIISV